MNRCFRRIVVFFMLMLSIQCNDHKKTNKWDLEKEIKALVFRHQQKKYLETIDSLDQKVRKDKQELEIAYGYDSKEVKEAFKKMVKTDSFNLLRIEAYLKTHGYPSIKKHGKKACSAPWLVIHHSPTIGARQRNFEYLYNAYKQGDLKPGAFSLYLNRFHTYKFGKRLTLPNPYREEDMIEALIDKLSLKKFVE